MSKSEKNILPLKCKICLNKNSSYENTPEGIAGVCKICRNPICFWHLTWQSKIKLLFFRFSNLVCVECYKNRG